MKKLTLMAVVFLLSANVLPAIDWSIYSGTESISDSDEYGIVNLFNSAELDVLGGSTNRIFGYNQSSIDISGGNINILEGWDESIFNLWGGSIGVISVPSSTTTFNIYGKNLGINGSFVQGNWGTGEFLSIVLRGEYRYKVILHEIPEPATLCFLALGAVLLKRKR